MCRIHLYNITLNAVKLLKPRVGASLSELPQYFGKAHHKRSSITMCPTPSLPPLFSFKSIELLIGSGEVLVYYIQRWRYHFNSRTALDKFAGEASEHILTDTMLKVHVCEPLHLFHGPLYLRGALSLPCGTFTPI